MLRSARRCLAFGWALAAFACGSPSVRSTTGLRVKRVRIAEAVALRARQPPPVELDGAKLERAVRLLDRHGVLRARPGVHTSSATDGTSVTMVVELADAEALSFELYNCPEPHVCGWGRVDASSEA